MEDNKVKVIEAEVNESENTGVPEAKETKKEKAKKFLGKNKKKIAAVAIGVIAGGIGFALGKRKGNGYSDNDLIAIDYTVPNEDEPETEE